MHADLIGGTDHTTRRGAPGQPARPGGPGDRAAPHPANGDGRRPEA